MTRDGRVAKHRLTPRRPVSAAVVLAAIGLSWGAGTSARAQSPPPTDIVYQSTVLERTTGEPTVYRETFPACNPSGTYELVLANGVDEGLRVSSGTVWLNGREVVGSSDLNQQVERVSRWVTLAPTNDLEVRLAGGPGGRARVTVYGDPRCLRVRITSPRAGSLLREPEALVEGELEALGTAGVRLRVGLDFAGQPVELATPVENQGRRFVARVALAPGAVRFTAEAADDAGRVAYDEVAVTFAPDPPENDRAFRPDVEPTVGFAPLVVTFGGNAASDPDVDLLDLDVDGDGLPDFRLQDFASPPHQLVHTYVSVGLYVATLKIRERTSGLTLTSRVPINVIPAPDLVGVWSGLRAALGRGDIEGALWFIALEAQARYRRVFEDLAFDLPSIAASFGDLTPHVVNPEYATASTTQLRDGDSEGFLVSFVRDGDGVWRIASF